MIEIMKINPDEGPAAYALVVSVAEQSVFEDYTEEGREAFRQYISPEFLVAYDADNFAFVARRDGGLVGVAKVRRTNHLSMLFVASDCQRQGLGRRLLAATIAECKTRHPGVTHLTANSSGFGLPFFQREGFKVMADIQTVNGISFTPIRLDFV